MIIPLPPPYDPHGGYPVLPLAMTAPSPLPPHDGYAPVQDDGEEYKFWGEGIGTTSACNVFFFIE